MLNLAAERHNRGLSAADAAKEIGVTQRILLGAEQGRRPQPRHAKLIADYYGVRVTDLWPVNSQEAAA
jgi:lambda repressor-like predicted transcriptional regulator